MYESSRLLFCWPTNETVSNELTLRFIESIQVHRIKKKKKENTQHNARSLMKISIHFRFGLILWILHDSRRMKSHYNIKTDFFFGSTLNERRQ